MKPSALDPERWQRIDQVLDRVLDVPPEHQGRVLAKECAADSDLRSEVEGLLDGLAQAGTWLDEPAILVGMSGASETGTEASRIGPFRILREIGRGGMGVVYLAEDTRLRRLVALKALPPYLGVGREAKLRFEAEARAVARLDHPNIATLYEIDETEAGQLYMAFAFYEGETLEARITRGPLPAREALEIAIAIAEGLGAAHEAGVIHRDVKPSNVLLSQDGGVKLLDFGVAKVGGENLTGEGVLLGTLAYMSPEHASAGPLDARADLWSLGVVLYEMLGGLRPFRGDSPLSLLQGILDRDPDPLALPVGAVPEPLGRVVDKLLAKDPDSRYQGAADVLADLRSVLAGNPPPVANREPPGKGSRPPGTVDPAAYEVFTLGRFHLERRTPEGLEQAQKYLRRAIEIDSDFAPAYAMLAEACGSATFFGLTSPAEGLPVVRSLVDRALTLDETSASAHAILGAVRHFGDWDWKGAEAALRRAIELNPRYAYAYFLLADVLSVLRRYEEALEAVERNRALEQFVPFSAFGPVIVRIHMGDFDRAIEEARAGLEFFTDFWQGHWLLALALMGKGLPGPAVPECEAAAEKSRRTPLALGALGLACARDGRREAAELVLRELEALSNRVYVGSSNTAIIHAGLGDLDRAFKELDRAVDQRDMALVHLADDVAFDDLRADPRFDELLRRTGLEGQEPMTT